MRVNVYMCVHVAEWTAMSRLKLQEQGAGTCLCVCVCVDGRLEYVERTTIVSAIAFA